MLSVPQVWYMEQDKATLLPSGTRPPASAHLFCLLHYIKHFSSTQMTRLVLPGMVERYSSIDPRQGIQSKDKWQMSSLLHRGTGLIINISSEAGVKPQPLLSLYSSTKVFHPPDITFISTLLFKHYYFVFFFFYYFRGLCYASQSACMPNTSQKE